MKNNTIVVIPAYNEEETIREVVEGSLRHADVYVVDDCSKDKTAEIVQSIRGANYLKHNKNTHIPRAILDGIRFALGKDYDYVITMDAGLSHDPDELRSFIKKPHSDLVVGVRKHKRNVPLYRKLLSRTATALMNISLRPIGSGLPRANFRDVTSGYRRYSRKAASLLLEREMKAKTFDFHTESFMLIYRNGLSISEVPISYHFSNSSLNMKVVRDGVRMFLDILLTRRC